MFESTKKLINGARKTLHKQRLESPTVTCTWHANKHKIYKLRQSYIVKNNKSNNDNNNNTPPTTTTTTTATTTTTKQNRDVKQWHMIIHSRHSRRHRCVLQKTKQTCIQIHGHSPLISKLSQHIKTRNYMHTFTCVSEHCYNLKHNKA